jgi:hypothetical protein
VGSPTDVLLLQLLGRVWLDGEVYAPIGISCLAAALRHQGYRVETAVVEPDVQPGEVPPVLLEARPALLGLSATGNEIEALKRLSLAVRRTFPRLPIVAGGYCSLDGVKLFEDSALDVVALGEGERTICDLARSFLKAQGCRALSLDEIDGILYRGDGGEIRMTPAREPIAELDTLARPEYEHLPRNTNLIRVYASRGCPYDCTFCEIKDFYPSKLVRRHGAGYMRRMIRALIGRANAPVETVYFNDDEFLLSPDHLEVMASVARDLDVRICFQTRTRDIIRHHRVIAGHADVIHQIHMGVESFSQAQLDRWRKKATVAENLEALHILSQMGVSYYPYMILSDKDTTVSELEESCAGMLAMPPCVQFVRMDGRVETIRQTPIHSGVRFNRMKTFYGHAERADETSYLEAVWQYLHLTAVEARRLSGLCAHGEAAGNSNASPVVRARNLLNDRVKCLPRIAAAAGCGSEPEGVSGHEAARFISEARETRIDYMAGVLYGG